MNDEGPARPSGGQRATQPSLVPGMVLLGLAAVLIIVVLVDPPMPGWLRGTIAGVAIAVVVLLLGYSVWVLRGSMRRGGGR